MQNRNSQGQFKRKTKLAIFTAFIVATAGIFFLYAPYLSKWLDSKNLEAVNVPVQIIPVANASVTTDAKVDQLKEQLLDKMVACENPQHIPIKQDDNKAGTLPMKDKVSIGDLQYKISTVQRHYKALHGTSLTDKEAINLALDTEKARELAIETWLKVPGSINEWTCNTPEMKQMVYDIRFLTSD